MSNTLRQRVLRIIASGAHALLDKLEDSAPAAVLEQSIREVAGVTQEVRTELGRVAASRHLAQQQHMALNAEHERLGASAAQAIALGRDDLASAALARQIDIEAQLPLLESCLAELAAQERELSGFVEGLMSKEREMHAQITQLLQAQAAVESQALRGAQGLAGSGASAKLAQAQAAIDRTYQRQSGLSNSPSTPNAAIVMPIPIATPRIPPSVESNTLSTRNCKRI